MSGKQVAIAAVIAAVTITWSLGACSADDLAGSARVIDGDTIAIGARHVRFEGIDAPETDQMCLDAHGEPWKCGIAARDSLSSHTVGRVISCGSRGLDRYGRSLAVCFAGRENLNAWMVREGWALAYVQYSR